MTIPDRTLLQWLEERSTRVGVHFSGRGDAWTSLTHAELADLTLRTSAALTERGVRRDDVVVVIQRSSPGFAATFFGTLAAGATVSSIAPPFAFGRADDYVVHAGHLLRTAAPALVVVDRDAYEFVRQVTTAIGIADPVVFDDLIDGVAPAGDVRPPAETALLQFTSGSSGFSRGVKIPTEALRANLTAMRRWLDLTPERKGLSWLPVHHDMGLVGCLTNLVVTGSDGWFMQPEDFIRSPQRYLTTLSRERIDCTAMPNFGLAYVTRRVRPADLDGLDFSGLDSVILGAERIDARTLEAFDELLAPHGFDRRALRPAFGGAEATLAVTGLTRGETWTAAAPDGEDEAEIVGCGRALEGVKLAVVDDDGLPVPDGTVGEIVVTGTSIASGYAGDPGSASGTSVGDGTLQTGDAGFLRDGQLFVIGRLGDGLKLHGRMVFAESIESQLAERGIPERRAAVLLGVRDGVQTAAIVLESPRPEWAGPVAEVVRSWLPETEAITVTVPRGGLAVTSSGKPRRRVMWKALCDGTLTGEIAPLDVAPAGS